MHTPSTTKGFTLIELMIVIAIIAIISAIAIPNLMEGRVTANDSASAASLKSGVMPAQVAFMATGYLNRDSDSLGEAGTLRMMAGLHPTSASASHAIGQIRCLTGIFADQTNYAGGAGAIGAPAYCEATGYRFAAYASSLNDADGITTEMLFETNSVVVPAAAATPINSKNGVRQWAVGCIPQSFGETGRRVFAMNSDGQVRSPVNALTITTIYGGAAPVNGTNGTAAALSLTIRGLYIAPAAMIVTGLDNAPTPLYPVYTK